MKKRGKIFMSSLLVVSMLFMSISPVFAYENSENSAVDDSFVLNIIKNNPDVKIIENRDNTQGEKVIKIQYNYNDTISHIKERTINNKIYLDVKEGKLENELIFDLENNDIFLNGKKVIATTTELDTPLDDTIIQPQSSWIYSDKPLYGTVSQYTNYDKTVNRNLYFREKFINLTFFAFSTLYSQLMFGYNIKAVIFGAALYIAFEYWVNNKPEEERMYAREGIYRHYALPNFYKKHVVRNMKNSNYTGQISSSTIYSGWAAN